MKGFIKEFKEFALKGNVMDLAIGMMIGSAFGKIVTSLVNDMIMPLFSTIFNLEQFNNLKVLLVDKGDASVYLNYGAFIQNIIDFLLIALCIFLFIKAIDKAFKKKNDEPAPAPVESDETKALNEIISILKEKK